MADRQIDQLERATSVGLSDLFVLEQSATAKSLTGQTLVNDLAAALDGHGGIVSVAKTGTNGLVDTYTITFADETTATFTLRNGRGISNLTWVDSGISGQGAYHTGTFTYNDNTSSQVVIRDGLKGDTGAQTYVYIKWSSDYPTQDSDMTNTPSAFIGICSTTATAAPTDYTQYAWYRYKGETGDTGASVSSISKTGTSGLIDVYTVNLDNSTTAGTFNVTNAKSISTISRTSGSGAPGTTDTYTIYYNDGDTSTFNVYNGSNGLGSVSTVSGIQPVNGDIPQVTSGNGAPTTLTVGVVNQLYYDLTGNAFYYCAGENDGAYLWLGTSVTVDSALSMSSTNPVQNAVITAKVGTAALNTTAQDLSGAVNEVLAAIPEASSTTPKSPGTAAVGTGTTWARADHVHPLHIIPSGSSTLLYPRMDSNSSTYSDIVGTSGWYVYSNHRHPLNVAYQTTSIAELGQAKALGSLTSYARTDHVHPLPTQTDSIVLTTSWTDSGNGYYTQTVTLANVTPTANSKVDLQPDATALIALMNDGVSALFIDNNNGTLTAYAVGAATTTSLTLQATVTEVR